MKRRFIICTISIVLLGCLCSCEGGIQGFLDKINQNALGDNTAAVDTAVQKVTGTVTTQGKSEDGTVTLFGQTIMAPEGFDTYIAPLEKNAKEEMIRAVGDAMRNDAAKAALIEGLSAPIDKETETAVRGTAAVLNAQFPAIREKVEVHIPEDMPEVKDMLDKVQSTLGKMIDPDATEISEVTKADVLIFQIAESVATGVVEKLPEIMPPEGGAPDIQDENGNIDLSAFGDEIIQDANMLLTLVTDLGEASSILNSIPLEELPLPDMQASVGE